MWGWVTVDGPHVSVSLCAHAWAMVYVKAEGGEYKNLLSEKEQAVNDLIDKVASVPSELNMQDNKMTGFLVGATF